MVESILSEDERRFLAQVSQEPQVESVEENDAVLTLEEFDKLLGSFASAEAEYASTGRFLLSCDKEKRAIIGNCNQTKRLVLEAYELALSKIK